MWVHHSMALFCESCKVRLPLFAVVVPRHRLWGSDLKCGISSELWNISLAALRILSRASKSGSKLPNWLCNITVTKWTGRTIRWPGLAPAYTESCAQNPRQNWPTVCQCFTFSVLLALESMNETEWNSTMCSFKCHLSPISRSCFSYNALKSPNKGETAVRVCFLVLSANHVSYGLANPGAVTKRTALFLSYCTVLNIADNIYWKYRGNCVLRQLP